MLRTSVSPAIRFFQDFEEDLGFAYIVFMNEEDSRPLGWRTSVMVEMEKVGGVWRIRALFPLEY